MHNLYACSKSSKGYPPELRGQLNPLAAELLALILIVAVHKGARQRKKADLMSVIHGSSLLLGRLSNSHLIEDFLLHRV